MRRDGGGGVRERPGATTANVNTGRGDGEERRRMRERKRESFLFWKNVIHFTSENPKGAVLVCESQRRSGEEARRLGGEEARRRGGPPLTSSLPLL